MIRFNLSCEQEHQFDGWFSSSDEFDLQINQGLLTCPACDSAKVTKSLMAPSVTTGRSRETMRDCLSADDRREYSKQLKVLRDKITENSEDVGRKFPEEARKIHYGEVKPRGIIGQADRKEVSELLDEGVGLLPLPEIPEDAN